MDKSPEEKENYTTQSQPRSNRNPGIDCREEAAKEHQSKWFSFGSRGLREKAYKKKEMLTRKEREKNKYQWQAKFLRNETGKNRERMRKAI